MAADADIIPGFVPGTVLPDVDPQGTGRVKVRIAGIAEPELHIWAMPAGWPGAGGVGRGSQYRPPPAGAQVFVMFERGRYAEADVNAIYLTGYYGLDSAGASAGPDAVAAASTAAKANSRTCIWEDANFQAYVTDEEDDTGFVIRAKVSGSKIAIRAKDGPSGKAETVTIEGRTNVSIFSSGVIDIQGSVVQIQGRRVRALTDAGI